MRISDWSSDVCSSDLGAVTRHICLHGAESTGKSTLAARLALRLGGLIVPEYGRTYAEANGTDLDETDLLAIFDGHRAATEAALAQQPDWLITDTDRSEERRVGKEGVSTCRSRGLAYK